jgi:carbonic anhydrase
VVCFPCVLNTAIRAFQKDTIHGTYSKFAHTSKQNPYSSYILSCGGQHFPSEQYVENEIYMFSFHFPADEAQIRMLVDAVVEVVKVAI